MESLWFDREANALIARCAENGIGRDLALRIYTTRLLGRDSRLVLHGGGNSSAFGGVDIVMSNAGAARQGRVREVDEAVLRRSFELNFFAHQSVAQNAVRVMRAQGTGGALLFNVSKQAVNPERDFGPYGLPEAATLFLMKRYALDHGGDGIRANAVKAESCLSGNLLKREVTAEDVADAFLFLAQARNTTAAVLSVDGGNIEASLR